MLPPHNVAAASAAATSLPPPVFHRLLDPLRLVDWHEALISFEYALLRPSKLAKQSVQRHHIMHRLSRDDPGLILLFFLMHLLTGPLFYLAVRPANYNLIRHFLFYPLCWSSGFAAVLAGALYGSIIHLLLSSPPSRSIIQFGNQANELGLKAKGLFHKNRKGDQSAAALAHILRANLNDNHKGLYIDYDLYLHCLDTALNSLIPSLFILGPAQYILLPLFLPRDDQSILGGGGGARFSRCLLGNTLYAFTLMAGAHALSCNLKFLPAPANCLAGWAFAIGAIGLIGIAFLTVCQININQIFLQTFYGL